VADPAPASLDDDILDLLDDLTDPDDCWYDHHGYCQAHFWLATDPRCPHARAKDILAAARPAAVVERQ
jgi:hypothetical protein